MDATPPPDAVSPLAGATAPWRRGAFFAGWPALVLWLAARHVFWRDEVRAFPLAPSGDGLGGMFAAAVQGANRAPTVAGGTREGYRDSFTTTPAQVRAFLAATTHLVRFAPATSDESYDVYLLSPPVTPS